MGCTSLLKRPPSSYECQCDLIYSKNTCANHSFSPTPPLYTHRKREEGQGKWRKNIYSLPYKTHTHRHTHTHTHTHTLHFLFCHCNLLCTLSDDHFYTYNIAWPVICNIVHDTHHSFLSVLLWLQFHFYLKPTFQHTFCAVF